MGSPEVSYDTPISWRNWFTLRCVFKRCEFRANAMVKRDELATQDEFETISKRLVNKAT